MDELLPHVIVGLNTLIGAVLAIGVVMVRRFLADLRSLSVTIDSVKGGVKEDFKAYETRYENLQEKAQSLAIELAEIKSRDRDISRLEVQMESGFKDMREQLSGIYKELKGKADKA